MNNYYDNYLQHFGIKGQKWGVRRFQNKDGTLTPKGKKRAAEESEEDAKQKKGLSDRQKKALVAGAAVVGTALAAYGGYKLHQLNKEATEGLSKQYHYKALDVISKANEKKVSVSQWENVANRARELGKMDNFNTSMGYAMKNRRAASELEAQGKLLQDLAQRKKYSVSDKVKYLKDKR